MVIQRQLALFAVIALTGCAVSGSVPCGDDRVCPRGLLCDRGHGECVSPEQVSACNERGDQEPCTASGAEGVCDLGVCIVDLCGDNIVGTSEVCDDGNLVSGDGCSADCLSDESCGNGILDAVNNEECDCGDGTVALPGNCAGRNSDEPGAQCRESCIAHCGDGEINAAEQCEAGHAEETSCVDAGFDRGRIGCGDLCQLDFANCRSMGFFTEDQLVLPAAETSFFKILDESLGVAGGVGFVAVWDGTAWTEVAEPFAGFNLLGLWASSPNNIFAAATQCSGMGKFRTCRGDTYRWDGSGWSLEQSNNQGQSFAAWGQSPTDVYIAGGIGASAERVGNLAHWDGLTWTDTEFATTSNLGFVKGQPSGDLWVADFVGQVWEWVDDAWSPIDPYPLRGVSGYGVRYFWPIASDDLWLGAGTNTNLGVAVHWDGLEWKEYDLAARPVMDIWASATNDVYAITGRPNDGYVLYQFDGTSFVRLDGDCVDLTVTGLDRPYLACNGAVWSYDGTAWLDKVSDVGSFGAQAVSRSEIYSVADGQLTRHNGLSSAILDTSTTVGRALDIAADGTLYYSGATDAVYRFDDPAGTLFGGGIGESYALWASTDGVVFSVNRLPNGTWELAHGNGTDPWTQWASSAPAGIRWNDVEGISSSDVFAVGHLADTGYIAHFGGTDWSVTRTEDAPLRALWFAGDGTGYAVGDQGRVLAYDGATWTPVSVPTVQSLVAVDGSSTNDVFVVSSTGEVWSYDGLGWGEVRGRMRAANDVTVLSDVIVFSGTEGIDALARTKPW